MGWPTTVRTRGAKKPSGLSSLVFLIDLETIYISTYSSRSHGKRIELRRSVQSVEDKDRRDIRITKGGQLAFD